MARPQYLRDCSILTPLEGSLLLGISLVSAADPGWFRMNALTLTNHMVGFDDSTEYFFALAPIPQPPNYAVFSKAQVVEFTSGCPSVAASVVYFTNSVFNPNSTDNGKYLTTLKQIAFWEFDRHGAVTKYDAWIPNIRLYTSITSRGITGGTVAPPSPAQEAAAITSLCSTTQKLCYGDNTQYSSVSNCIDTLNSKPFGDEDNIWSDSVVCRQIHALLARIRPAVSHYSSSGLQRGNLRKGPIDPLPTFGSHRWR